MEHVSRNPFIDCLRAVAIVAVFLFHLAGRHYSSENQPSDFISQFFMVWGKYGVDVFFPLSGFLICGMLFNVSKKDGIKQFFIRRFFRIVPIYYAAIITYGLGYFLIYDSNIIIDLWKNALFLTGFYIFFDGAQSVHYTITWSLSVEEFAYIILGSIAILGPTRFYYALWFIVVVSILIRMSAEYHGMYSYHFPPARLDSIALGGIVAWHALSKKVIQFTFASLVLFCLLSALSDLFFSIFFYNCVALGSCLCIMIANRFSDKQASGLIRVMSSVGFYSYFIYLFHMFFIDLTYLIISKTNLIIPFWPLAVVIFLSVFVAAYFSFVILEGPLIRYGRSISATLATKSPS